MKKDQKKYTKRLYDSLTQFLVSLLEEPKEEQWKIIPNTGKKIYMVSENGDIISFCKGTKPRKLKGNIQKGYKRIEINKKQYRVNRIVAECFIENPDNKEEVHHKDKDTMNNNKNNLQWVSKEEHKAIHYPKSKE